MPTFFQRPENALKRANEFIDVGKKQRALDALYDVIKSKKHRTWQKIHEPIMEKYLQLCVELKKSHVAKEGLYQYKNICQQVNIKSLEDVIRRYLSLAEEKTEAARLESHQAVVDVDDLDVLTTPENLLLSAVSGEDTQDRTDRAILTPWVKFLWESYRQCLDLLRNNSSVEKLYQDIAQQAFKFCLKYARKTEFRKLCDNLRTHLSHVYKHQHQQRAINLNNPDSQALHLETRLAQLDSAIQMELWQEAFKAVEDIHGLITLSKKPPKPSLMANYYQKLGLVFWKSGNHMFHACAWHRLLHLSREQRKNLSQEELQRLASRVLCATLAIPIPPSRNQVERVLELDETTMEKQRRLATLLGMNNPPNRSTLVKDLLKFNVIQHVHPEMQNLYRWLELEFHPLKLSTRVASSLEFIGGQEELAQYVPALQDISITRLLKQVSQVYQTIEFSRLVALAPFTTVFYMERAIVEANKTLDIQVRINHRTKSVSFGTDLGVAQKEDVPEGPYLQAMPSEQIRNQLAVMASVLNKAVAVITPVREVSRREELRTMIIHNYRQTAKKEHMRILLRRQIIEERKEELENLNTQRERQEQEFLEEQERVRRDAEMARLEREAKEREEQRRLEERKEIQRRAAREKLDQLMATPVGARVFEGMDEAEIAELDTDEIVARQVEQLEKEKKEMQEKLRQQEKKVDFYERAKRMEEIPILQKIYEEEKVKNKEFWEVQEAQRIETMKNEREVAMSNKERLSRMEDEKNAFLAKLNEARMSVYKDKVKEFDKKLAEEKKKRMIERKQRRKEERRQKWLTEREEEKQRKIDEELIRQREEEERLAREKQEQEEQEYQEKIRKLEEMSEKQRQREREIEEREAKKREELKRSIANTSSRDRREESEDGGKDGGPRWKLNRNPDAGWRAKERARQNSWTKKDDEDEREAEGGDRDRDRFDTPKREEARETPRWADRKDEEDDRRPPPREGGGAWRRDGPPRDGPPRDGPPEREWRDSPRGPPREDRDRDDRGPRDSDSRGPPPRDRDERGGGGGAWRPGGGGWRDRGTPSAPSEGRDEWRRGGARDRDDRDDRGPRDRDFRDDRGPRDRDFRDDRGPRDRDFRDDRGPRDRDFRDDRGPRDRDFGDRGARDRDFRDDRGPRDREGGSAWRRGGGTSAGGGDEPRGAWRRGGATTGGDDRERREPRDDRGAAPPRDDWRRGGDKGPERPARQGEDDGWTTVKR